MKEENNLLLELKFEGGGGGVLVIVVVMIVLILVDVGVWEFVLFMFVIVICVDGFRWVSIFLLYVCNVYYRGVFFIWFFEYDGVCFMCSCFFEGCGGFE